MNKFWRNYSLSIVLASLFLASWLGQFVFQVAEVTNQALEHGQEFSWSEFWPEFGAATLENWQSEFLQLLTFVTLTTMLMHKGSPESKDSDLKTEASLHRIEQQLKTLSNSRSRAAKR